MNKYDLIYQDFYYLQNEQMAKADGKVTKAERAKLHREENRASKRIYKQKHDASTTTPAR